MYGTAIVHVLLHHTKNHIPGVLKEYNEMLHTGPTWAEMCRQREEAAEKMRKQLNE